MTGARSGATARRPVPLLVVVVLLALAASACTAGTSSSGPTGAAVSATATAEPVGATTAAGSPVGVPPGQRLRTTGPLHVRADGAVLEGLDVQGQLVVDADRVVVRRSRITAATDYAVELVPGHVGLVVEDVEVVGRPGCAVGVAFDNYVARRVDVHGCTDGLHAGTATTIDGCLVHGLRAGPGSHADGIQLSSGTGIVVEASTVLNDNEQTSAVLLKADFGPIDGVVVRGNHLDGGSYALYARAGAHGLTGVTVSGNTFGRAAGYGPASVDVPVAWSDNSYTDGDLVPLP